MVYKKYGEVFHSLREHNGFPLSAFSNLGISKPALSRFERGESMMSFEKVTSALSLMGVSLEEYEHFINSYSKNESDYLIDEIENANLSQDKEKLLKLEKMAKQQGFLYISLAAKASRTILSESEVEKLTSRLLKLDFWSYKELCIFFLVIEQLNTNDILKILSIFLEQEHNLFKSAKYRSYLVQACCRAVTACSTRGYKDYAEFILNRINTFKLVNSMYLRNLVNITTGYWIYCFDKHSNGDQIMLEALIIFKEISTPEIYKYYQSRYDQFILKKS